MFGGGDGKGDARGRNLGFGARKALAHGRLGIQKGAGDIGGAVEAAAQMRAHGVIDQRHRGCGHAGQTGNFARVVHAQFDHSQAVLGLQTQQRERHAHVVVEVAFGREGALARRLLGRLIDGEALPVPPASFDAVVCRLGLMFFPDPQQGLRAMHRALRTGGGICTVVFSRPERNPCIGLLMATALRHSGLPARNPNQPGGLLSLGQPGLCDQLFQSAGFRQVATTALDAPFRLPTARHYLDFVRASASPIQQILGRLEPEAAEAAWADMEERLGKFNTPGGWVGPNELLLTAAQR